jgi:ubiquinone biosynthesis protein
LTAPIVHTGRLLKWGRVLARHGALRGIERDANTPPQVRRLARIARFGARVPGPRDYAEAFQESARRRSSSARRWRPGPTWSAKAAHDLQLLQDNLPPAPFEQIRGGDRAGARSRSSSVSASSIPEPVGAASIAQVHRAVTTDGRRSR